MNRAIVLPILFVILGVAHLGAFEVGDTVVTVRDCELKEGGGVVTKAQVGDQYSVQAIDGHRLLLSAAGSVWGDRRYCQ